MRFNLMRAMGLANIIPPSPAARTGPAIFDGSTGRREDRVGCLNHLHEMRGGKTAVRRLTLSLTLIVAARPWCSAIVFTDPSCVPR
jgi:hypothetical protein